MRRYSEASEHQIAPFPGKYYITDARLTHGVGHPPHLEIELPYTPRCFVDDTIGSTGLGDKVARYTAFLLN